MLHQELIKLAHIAQNYYLSKYIVKQILLRNRAYQTKTINDALYCNVALILTTLKMKGR